MITEAIDHCQKFLTALKAADGVCSMAMDEADVKNHTIACVRADYLQEVVDAARRVQEMEVQVAELGWMLDAAIIR